MDGVYLGALEVFARGLKEEQKTIWVHHVQDDGLSRCPASGGEDVPK